MKSRFVAAVLMTVLVAPAMVSMGGCAMGNTSIANENLNTLNRKLIPGKTTKAQVLQEFGEPSEKSFVAGRESWRYRMVDTQFRTYVPFVGLAMGDSGTVMTDVVVLFDKAGVVVRHDLTKTKG